MSSNKDQPKLEIIDTDTENCQIVIRDAIRAHIEHVIKERDQYKAQVERLQAVAALAQAQYGQEAHARIQGLEAELQEYEKLRISTDVTLELSERVRQALEAKLKESEELRAQSEAKVKELEAQAQESERLKTEAEAQVQALQKVDRGKLVALEAKLNESEELRAQSEAKVKELEAQKTEADLSKVQALEAKLKESEELRAQSEAKVKELEGHRAKCIDLFEKFKKDFQTQKSETDGLKIQAEESKKQVQALQRDLAISRSKFDHYKAQTLGEFEELENARIKAHQAHVAQRVRCSELESKSQALQQALASGKTAYSNQIRALEAGYQAQLDELQALYNKDTKDLKKKLIEARRAEPSSDRLKELQALKKKLAETEALAESQEEQFKDLKVIQMTNLGAVKWQLNVKENEVVTLQRSLEAANWKLDTEQKKFEALQQEQRENAEYVMEMNDKLEEVEAKLAEAQAPKKRGRPVKEETAAKKRKLN